MSPAPDVSVVIPTAGSRRFLPLTLAAALRQDDVLLEVIVVDDASTDGTAAMLEQLDEPSLHVVRHEQRRGVAAARNLGLATARGEWIAFLDDDDLWSPRKLRTQLDAAAAGDASFAYGASVIIDESGCPFWMDFEPPRPSDLLPALLSSCVMPAPGSNVVARRALVQQLGGFDERARFDDWDMWIRLAAGARAASCPEVLIGYRRHSSNRVLATQDEVLPGVRYLAEKHRALSLEHGVEFDELVCRRWVAWSYRRVGARLPAARAYAAAAVTHRTPSDLGRAARALLGGWGILGRWRSAAPPPDPDWLVPYRSGSATSPQPGR